MANPQSSTTPTAIAKATSQMPPHVQRLYSYLKPRMDTLAMYAAKLVDPETLIKLACYEASRPESAWLEKSTPESVYASLIIAAQLGLEPGHVRGEGYLVPFKGLCSFMPGYRGFIKLAIASGMVNTIRARPVFEGDDFAVMQGTEEWIRHVPAINSGRTLANAPEVIAAYAVCNFKGGTQEFSVLDRWQLDKRRAASQNGPAWKQWPEEMFAKTPIRHGSKQWPLGGRFAAALKVDEAIDTGRPEAIREVIDLPDDAVSERGDTVQVIEKPSRIQEAAERASKDAPRGTGAGAAPTSPKWRPVGGGLEATLGNWSLRVEKSGEGFAWVATTQDGEIAEGAATDIESAKRAAEAATTRVGP